LAKQSGELKVMLRSFQLTKPRVVILQPFVAQDKLITRNIRKIANQLLADLHVY
jgi:uncharacterized protein (UPF0147 family)